MKESDKIYEYVIFAIEFKYPKGRLWHLWHSGLISKDRDAVEKAGEKWWGKDGWGRNGYRYRVATFKRV